MEAIPEFTYQVEHNPEPKRIDKIKVHTTFIRPANMEPGLNWSSFSCLLPTIEFIADDASPHKQKLFYFLTNSGVSADDAMMLILKLIEIASEVASSVVYCSEYALTMWLTLEVVPSSQDSVLHDPHIEEAVQASLDDYEKNNSLKPASKLVVKSLRKRKYKTNRKTISICSIPDRCTICLKDYTNKRRLATLPCAHEFHNTCIVNWLKINHVCPLCRFELPCEDDEFSHTTNVF